MTTPQNRLVSSRDSGGRFAKGVTGNPGGRPKGLASYIRQLTNDGQDLVDEVMHILRHPNGKGIQAQKLQLDCIMWLADRGFGKAALGVEHTGEVSHAYEVFSRLSTAELEEYVSRGREARALSEAKVIEGDVRAIE